MHPFGDSPSSPGGGIPPSGPSGAYISKLLLMETGTYNDMAYRPYQTNLTLQTAHQVQEATQGGKDLSASTLSGVVGGVVSPSTEPHGAIQIPNGFAERRFRFMMEVIYTNDNSALSSDQTRQIICGYTDHPGATRQGSVDPQMVLYFNSSVIIRDVVELQGGKRVVRSTPSDASHLLSGDYQPNFDTQQVGHHLMRPQDLFNSMSSSLVQSDMVFDARTTFASGAQKSRRSNTCSPTYLSRTLQAYKQATQDDQNFVAAEENLYDNAHGLVRERLISQDPFLAEVSMRRFGAVGGGSLMNNNITFGELEQMSPGLDGRTAVVFAQGVSQQPTNMPFGEDVPHSRGVTEHWGGTNVETVAATTISHSVPSLMADLMLTKAAFSFTNKTLTGEPDIRIMDARSFADNIDLTPYIEVFINRLAVEVMRDLTRNNMFEVEMIVQVDMMGETHINISMNGGPHIHYCTPSFCDALMAPVLATSNENLRTVAHDVQQLSSMLDTESGASTAKQNLSTMGDYAYNETNDPFTGPGI